MDDARNVVLNFIKLTYKNGFYFWEYEGINDPLSKIIW